MTKIMVFIYSKMVKQIVISFTMLLIIKEYKGAQCEKYISDYADIFNMNGFEEFNLMCYVSMYASIKGMVSYIQKKPNEPIPSMISAINDFNIKLLRVNSWRKYLMDPSGIWKDFNNIRKWTENPNDAEIAKLVLKDATSTLTNSKFKNYIWTTPRGIKFYEKSHITSKTEIRKMVVSTFNFCQKTLNTLSIPTAYLERPLYHQFIQNFEYRIPMAYNYGFVLLLIKDEAEYFKLILNKSDDDQAMSLVYIIGDVLQDMYISMVNTLLVIYISRVQVSEYKIKTEADIDVELLKIMITVFRNVLKLTEELFNTKDLKGVKESLYEIDQTTTESMYTYLKYNYETFSTDFKQIWLNKLSFGSENYETKVPAFNNGRLIKYGRVEPSIIGYYEVYKESWEHLETISCTNNMDDRITILLEINAWAIILNQILRELRKNLRHRGYQDNLTVKPDFKHDIVVIMQFKTLFERNI